MARGRLRGGRDDPARLHPRGKKGGKAKKSKSNSKSR
jgi:hypothetical protein